MTKKQQNNSQLDEYVYLPLNDTKKYFYSHDIGLVADLLCQNFELAGLDKEIKNKILFIIKKGSGINKAINNYWAFNSSVDAQSYFNQLKRLKNQIFSSD